MEISPECLVSLSSLIAIEISNDKTIEQINTYKNLFSMIASNMQAIVNQNLYNQKK